MTRQELFTWIRQQYGTEPEYPWHDWNAVLRHNDNNKWYGVVLEVSADKLGLPEAGIIIHRNNSTRLNRLKHIGSGSGEWSGKRENGNGWQNCMRTAMIVLLLLLDIQMAAHRMV